MSREADRYLPMAKTVAATIRRQLELNVDIEDLMNTGAAALEDAVNTFRRGHGTTFRIFAHYRIALAIYRSLNKLQWPDRTALAKYHFYQKSDELLDWHSRSSENVPRRTLDAEIIELKKLLRVLVASAFLICENKENALENLPPSERDLLRLCFQQHMSLEQAAMHLDLAINTARRLQFRALMNLTDTMRH